MMAFGATGNQLYIMIFMCFSVEVTLCIEQTDNCPAMTCDVTTLENGETVGMVPKSLADEVAWWMKDIPELKNIQQRLICALPDCLSNPCKNGGTCTETLDGFTCTCSTEFYGQLCNCPIIIHTPDVGGMWKITYPGLNITQGMTSFHFEVSANHDAVIVLSQSFDEDDLVYAIVIGKHKNERGCFRKRPLATLKPTNYDYNQPCLVEPPALHLSGIPSYDHYQVSFEGDHIKMGRYGSDVSLINYSDTDHFPTNKIRFVGILTGWGSGGYWKFPTFCED